MEIEIKFKAPVKWIKRVATTHSAMIKIRDIRRSEEGVKDLVEIFIPQGKLEGLSEEIYAQNSTGERHIAVIDEHHATAIVDAEDCPVCRSISNWDLFLIEAHSDENGDVRMNWLVPDEETASNFLERLKEDGVDFDIIKKKSITKRGDITARQEFVVRTALELGFYDYPKRINLEGLSKRLNVSYVTLAEILRRAEKNIISSYFKNEK